MRKIALCAALACVCCMSSIPVNAAELSDEDAYLCYDVLEGIIDNYGLDTSAEAGDNSIAYFYGRTNQGAGYPVACLWVGSTGYRCTYRDDLEVPEVGYYTANYSCNYTAKFAGYLNLVAFWYDPSVATDNWKCNIIAGRTDNLIGYNTVSAYTDAVEYSELNNLDELLASLAPEEPTETPVETAPPFTLPDEWINGGETLPAATEVTYPSGFDPEDAFQQFEDITYELEEDTKSGIGFFWEFLTRIIDSLGIWNYVFFAMLFGLIVWFLKGA